MTTSSVDVICGLEVPYILESELPQMPDRFLIEYSNYVSELRAGCQNNT